MATVADYDVVIDDAIVLTAAAGGEPDREFDLEFDPNINLGVRSVLSYMVDPGSAGVTFTMTSVLNGTVLVKPTALPAQSGHVRQEVIDGNTLTNPDRLKIRVTAGSATFSDIVLLHQSDVS